MTSLTPRRVVTLGINAAFHDSAAALVVDGQVIAASEEERYTRIKHGKRPVPFTAWELPFNAIDACLAAAGMTLRDVTDVAYSFDPEHFTGAPLPSQISLPLLPRADSTLPEGSNPWDPLFIAYIANAPRQLVDGAPHHLRKRLAGLDADAPGFRWHFVDHHLSHQASACLAAPFDRCAVMTLDGRGERATTTYGHYAGQRYDTLGEVVMPHSLGLLYERVTTHLGFLHSSDEYKVMAMAALGRPRFKERLMEQVHIGERGQYRIDPMDLTALFGPSRIPGSAMDAPYLDLAASLQEVLEDSVLAIATWLRDETGERALAMAGGVALNCVMNSRLRDSGIFEQVWVQPAAGDAGTALGAALWTDARTRLDPMSSQDRGGPSWPLAPRAWQMRDVYLGPGFDDEEIERQLRWAKLTYRRVDDLAEETAVLLAEDKIIGWFQGRMEYGPRSLGARSLLASPIHPDMQARLNDLKDREDFRPVAPAIPVERLADWFEPAESNGGESPFMLFIYDVKPGQGARIPSACHTDRTARVQTVSAETNPKFHALLEAFGRRTGVPVLVNTSFNVRGEPIVYSPRAAIEAFFSTPLDALVIGSFIVEKIPS